MFSLTIREPALSKKSLVFVFFSSCRYEKGEVCTAVQRRCIFFQLAFMHVYCIQCFTYLQNLYIIVCRFYTINKRERDMDAAMVLFSPSYLLVTCGSRVGAVVQCSRSLVRVLSCLSACWQARKPQDGPSLPAAYMRLYYCNT